MCVCVCVSDVTGVGVPRQTDEAWTARARAGRGRAGRKGLTNDLLGPTLELSTRHIQYSTVD